MRQATETCVPCANSASAASAPALRADAMTSCSFCRPAAADFGDTANLTGVGAPRRRSEVASFFAAGFFDADFFGAAFFAIFFAAGFFAAVLRATAFFAVLFGVFFAAWRTGFFFAIGLRDFFCLALAIFLGRCACRDPGRGEAITLACRRDSRP